MSPGRKGEEGMATKTLDLKALKEKSVVELTKLASDLKVPGAAGLRKQEMIFEILRAQT